MSMIKAEHLSFCYPGSYDPVFENVSFTIDTDWRLGFVGRNGRGKTTFLRLLMGAYEYEGRISATVSFDYFPYAVEDEERYTGEVLSDICPEVAEWQFVRELSLMGMEEDIVWRIFSTLSGGEKTRVLLAALFLREGHFLLIDEPTNHLDTEARQTLAEYLARKRGFILVSHDRAFLDACTDHTLSINRTNIEVQNGSFSSWKENFDRRQAFEEEENRQLQKEIGHLKKAAARASGWADRVEASKHGGSDVGFLDRGFVGHKSAKMMKRAKSIESRTNKAIEEKSALLKNTETAEALKLSPLSYYSSRLASFSEVEILYDGKAVCAPMTFEVERGDRILLSGRNGSGKSSLLKLLCGSAIEHRGRMTVGSGLVISYVPQDTSHLFGSLSAYAKDRGIDESLFKAILRKMDFERAQFDKNMEDFSGGQKKKVLIAGSLCQRAHLYVWDEPLNFIDIYARMQIEALLRDFAPTMIFVEHDRAFGEAIATKKVCL